MARNKTSVTKKTVTRKKAAKKPSPKQRPTYGELRQQLAEALQRCNTTSDTLSLTQELQNCKRQLGEALEQQSATSEILSVIATSPTDIQPVLDVVARNAAHVCGATDASIFMQIDNAGTAR
jgi:hypothetical protein